MKEARSRPFEPICQVHEGFFINAVYIQDDDYQGYLSKRLSPGQLGGFCTCVDRSMDLQVPNDCELFKSPAPVYNFDSDLDETNQASTTCTDTLLGGIEESSDAHNRGERRLFTTKWAFSFLEHGLTSTGSSVFPYDEDGLSQQATTDSYSPSISSFDEHSDSEPLPSAPPEAILETRFLRAAKMKSSKPSNAKTLRDVQLSRGRNPAIDQRARKRLPSSGPSDAPSKRHRLLKSVKKPSAKRNGMGSKKGKGRGKKQRQVVSRELPPKFPDPEGAGRAAKDKFLVEQRNLGHPYSEIKAMGKFREAESTLRGRFRTLTKDREERVRKPQWTKEDMDLLPSAVHKACQGQDPNRMHVPWEKVAAVLHEMGGSYRFGSGACHKMWDKLEAGKAD
ncbi:hypothetical protein HJFPF1_02679 [Paramyrothecium foliicola]|nr:hypothetical protein HJFPF1_02679 [Paramyrothecium foliicola]